MHPATKAARFRGACEQPASASVTRIAMIPRMAVTTLIFDVMGTVVDIEGSIARQAREVLDLEDGALGAFVAGWEGGLEREMGEIVAGRAPWRPHRELRAAALA